MKMKCNTFKWRELWFFGYNEENRHVFDKYSAQKGIRMKYTTRAHRLDQVQNGEYPFLWQQKPPNLTRYLQFPLFTSHFDEMLGSLLFFSVNHFLTFIFSLVAHTFPFQRKKKKFLFNIKESKCFLYHHFSFNLAIQYFKPTSHLVPISSHLFTSLFLVPRVVDIVLSLSSLFVGSVVVFPPAVPNPAPLRSR